MGNLRDQLKKAKVLSEKEARRLAHEERVKRKEVGREGLESEQAKRQREIEAKRQAERERDRTRELESESARQAEAERAACLAILDNEAREPARGGAIWHFEVEGGFLPFFRTSETDRHQLASGTLVAVRRGPPGTFAYGVLPRHLADRVKRIWPERVYG